MKNAKTKKGALFLVTVFFFLFFSAGCTALKLNSTWKRSQITVDGESSDWIENMFYLESKKVLLGIRNDFDCFYMCMIVEESSLRSQMMRSGFILWFDPDGGKDKTFGIKFPLGMNPENRKAPSRDKAASRENLDFDREMDQTKNREFFEKTLSEIELLSSKKDPGQRMPLEEVKGIDVRLKALSGIMVYEIKVPLKKSEDYPYAVNAGMGETIGICLEIPKMESGDMMQGRRPSGIGGGTPGGGMGGGRRSGMGPGSMSQPKGLNIWLIVTLTAEGSTVSI